MLYHMAEQDSWPQIKTHGLLSASALLDLFEVKGARRAALQSAHRPVSVVLEHPRHGTCVLRDQRPMPPKRLRACLPRKVSPGEWYRLLNSKVFFWTSAERLLKLLNALNYRGKRHDILIVDAARLVKAHQDSIELCHINSGNTFPYLHKKTLGIFKTISDYPVTRSGNPKPPVVELLVEYAVPDIRRYVLDVRSKTGNKDYGTLLK